VRDARAPGQARRPAATPDRYRVTSLPGKLRWELIEAMRHG
jgi:hypothetical protein